MSDTTAPSTSATPSTSAAPATSTAPAITASTTAGTGTPPPAPVRRRLTGLKPTGHLQLGNYLGAIRPMVQAQSAASSPPGSDSVVAVVDLHALTVDHRPHEVRALTLEQATTLLAAGVDPQRTTLFVQSQVPEHTELHYLLECATGYGEAQRMIQFKQKAGAQRHVRLSLLTYPVLMTADILMHDTDEVPVGDDQSQHLELARDVATRFNHRYGDTFTVPRAVKPAYAARIMDLADPTVKMEKSATDPAGVLYLLDPPDVLRRKIKRAVTDGDGDVRHDPATKPGVSNLLEILAACTGTTPADAARDLPTYARLKAATTEAVIETLAPLQHRHAALSRDPGQVRQVLAAGAARARERAGRTVARARRAIGLL
jgi:tryptophanyl-tRNA synthetase